VTDLYGIYLNKKQKNPKKLYLFKNGSFYIFLGDDAVILSEKLSLKLTDFSKKSMKCGFPINQLNKHLKFIELLGYECEIVLNGIDTIIKDIKEIDLDILTLKEAYEKIKEYKEILNES